MLQAWAAELSPSGTCTLDTDDIKLLEFEDARGGSGLRPEPENVTAQLMLDDLGTEADARRGEKDEVGVLLVKALREWSSLHPSTDA